MLAAALAAEVAAFIEAHSGEVDVNGHRLVVRNGFHAEQEVTTVASAVTVAVVRAGARFENGKLVERPDESGADQQAA